MLASFVIFILNTGLLTAAQGIQDCAESYPSNWTGKYHGTMNTTVTGKTCKMWSDTHLSHYGHINNCLAPREDIVSSKGPWCFIEGGWEFCFVPLCNKDCRKSIHDREYNGTLNITISGLHCRNWSLTSNLPSGGNPSDFHDETLNYCRTPSKDAESTPWCYTSSTTTRWERCNVSLCGDIRSTICPDLNGSDLLIEPSILTGYQYNSVVTFKCKNGYMIHGPTEIRCTVNADKTFKGHWNATQPVCVRVECPPILIDHSKIQKSNIITRYPDMIHVQCDIGYQLNGNGSIQCTESGNWSNMPSCNGIKCPLITLEHSNVLSRSIRFPETIQVKCNSGYQLNGSSSILCTQSGNWSPLPTCDGIKCPLITLEHSNVLSRSIRFPETIQVKCNSGYQLNGSSSILCTQSGNWSPLPTCDEVVYCPDLILRPHLVQPVKISGYQYNNNITFICDVGYSVVGNRLITCTESGQWSGSIPTCDPLPCPVLNISNMKKPSPSVKYYYKDAITIQCEIGYVLNGTAKFTCLASGMWNAPLPVCKYVSCKTRSIPLNVQIMPQRTEYFYNENVTFFCNADFFGTSVRSTCSINGQWEPAAPKCLRPWLKSDTSDGVSYGVLGVVIGCLSLLFVTVVTVVVIYFRRMLKETTSHYEDIKMASGSMSSRDTEDVYTELK